MRKAGAGRIIAIGSRAAEDPGPNVGSYSASKAALVSLIRTVALENKENGITANVILPGTMDTPANRKAMPGADTSIWVQPASVASLQRSGRIQQQGSFLWRRNGGLEWPRRPDPSDPRTSRPVDVGIRNLS